MTGSTLRASLTVLAETITDQIQSKDINQYITSSLGAGEWAGFMNKQTFQALPGMPLTGSYHLHIDGTPPLKARLILVYTEPSH